MAVVFVLTIQSPTALTIRHPENTWAIGGPATIVTRTAAGETPIETLIVTATIAVGVGVVMIGIKIGTLMDAIAATGATDAAQRQAGVADDTRPTTGVAGATPEAHLGEAAPPELTDGTMMHQQQVPLLQLMRLGGERLAIVRG
jgi:hypothetical protein